ncbi:MAG: hypothetical protein MI742_11860 [Desulfobacterales bacterium]|nr:hypothetical protein [Desulfobacterales bacterium]
MNFYIGVDVQVRRPCSYAVLDEAGQPVDSGWFEDPECFARVLSDRFEGEGLQVAIDACRTSVETPRAWNWMGQKGQWRPRKSGERGWGRHCDVVIKALNLGNPQWTPPLREAPLWMQKGFALFKTLAPIAQTHEAFPTATYRLLHRRQKSLPLHLDLSSFAPGPKDMLDAFTNAATVRAFCLGRGCEVGGGDGLGTIVLPEPVAVPFPLDTYPAP